MDTRALMAAVFVAGLCIGWLGNTWLGLAQTKATSVANGTGQNVAAPGSNSSNATAQHAAQQVAQSANSAPVNANDSGLAADLSVAAKGNPVNTPQDSGVSLQQNSTGTSATDNFKRLLSGRFYFDAMVYFQEQVQVNSNYLAGLKKILLSELNKLLENRNNSDFSELIENYLSIYYDDIDILLLLAEFDKTNESYLEAIDVYLLANTYAYSDTDQKKVDIHFDAFVKETDGFYTRQENWWPLINLFSHIDTSGLMNSTYQYRQAIAHLRSGDELFAVEKLTQLIDDRVVGESATIALNTLMEGAEVPAAIPDAVNESVSQTQDSIPLVKRGNQYLVELENGPQNSVSLLIDTGASMTVISTATFSAFNANGDAVEQERRVFQTAGGVVMGTVYLVPELRLGPYSLQNTQVAVIDLDADRQIDGLLGMNILGQFRFQLDQENAQLLLNAK